MTMVRDTGRTTTMLKALGEGRSVVVVHNDKMREEVLRIVRRLNAEDNVARNVVAISVTRLHDARRLYGLSCPIAVDHAFWDSARRDVADEVHILAERAASRIAGTGE